MKKVLFLVSIITLTACVSSNEEVLQRDTPQNINVVDKTMNKTDGELSEEEIYMQEALEEVQKVRDSFLNNNQIDNSLKRRPVINCHTSFSQSTGHACVFNNGYLYNMSWQSSEYVDPRTGQHMTMTSWHSVSVHSCNC